MTIKRAFFGGGAILVGFMSFGVALTDFEQGLLLAWCALICAIIGVFAV